MRQHSLSLRKKFALSALIAGSFLSLPAVTRATDISWSATAADTAWATASNWVGGTAPVSDLTTDRAVFNQASYAFQPNAGTRSIAGILMGTSGAVTISSTALTIGAQGIDMSLATNGMTLSNGVTIGAAQNWNVASGQTLAANGIVTLTNRLTLNGPGTVTLAGANAGTGGITLSSGQLNINNATALGATAGTFIIGGGTISNGSAITVSTNNAMQWNGNFTHNAATALNLGTGAVTLNAARTITVSGAGALTVGGGITGATFGITKAGTGSLVLNGVVGTTTGGITVSAGTLTLGSAANTYTGATTISGGTLSVGNVVVAASASGLGNATSQVVLGGASTAGTLIYTGAAATYTRGFSVGAGGGGLTNNGSGTLTITTAAASPLAGVFTVGGSAATTFSYAAVTPLSFTGVGALTKAGTTTLTFTGTGGNAVVAGAMPINIQAGTLQATTTAVATTNLLGTGTVAITPGATLGLSVGAVTTTLSNPISIPNGAGNSIISTSGGITLSGAITLNGGGSTLRFTNTNGSLFAITSSGAISGTGSIALNPTGTNAPITLQTGTINITGGISNIGTATAAASLSTISSPITTTNLTGITQAGTNPFTVSSALALTGAFNSFTSSSTGTFTLSGAITGAQPLTYNANSTGLINVTTGGVNNAGTITNAGTGTGTTTISSAIGANVTNIVENSATSQLVLSGTNTYTGTSTATAGVLDFTTSLAIPGYATSPATAFGTFASPKMSAASGATIAFPFGGANSISATDVANFSNGTYNIFAAGSSLGIDTTQASGTLVGTVITNTNAGADALGLTKTGANTLTLDNANTYTGPTAVINGTLSVSAINNVGAASGPMGAPTTVLNGTISLGRAATTGILSYTGAGETTDRVINLAGVTGGGGIDNSGTGTLVIGSPLTFAAGTKTLTLSGASNTNFNSPIVGTVSTGATPLTITKAGTGTVTLSGANVATTLTISGGTFNTGAGGLTLGNVGAATINTTGATAGSTVFVNGLITLTGVGAAANGADVGAAANTTLDLSGTVIAGGPTNNIDFNPSGTLILGNSNTYQGQTQFVGTTVNVPLIGLASGLVPSSFGQPSGTSAAGSPNSTILLQTGVFKYVGTGETTDRVLDHRSATAITTLDQSGTGLLKFSSAITASVTSTASKVWTLQGSTTGTGELAGAIPESSATFTTGITKAGTGTWTLSGINTYTGPTTVNGGNLRLTTGTTNTSAVTVNNGGTLSILGNYTIGNATTAAKGGSLTLAAGGILDLADGAISTLTLTQNATFATAGAAFNGGTIKLDVSGAAADSIVNSGGTIGSTSSGSNYIVVNPIAGFAAGGPYTIINGGAGTGSISNANFFLASSNINVGGTPYTLALSQSGTNELLTITPGVSLVAPGAAFWNGTTSSSWSAQPGGPGTATNWFAGVSGPDTFSLPGVTSNIFMASNAVGVGGLTTTIDGVGTINSLNFTGTGTSNTAGSTINAGTGTSLTINATAVNGNVAGNGITVAAGSGANLINLPVVLGGSQSWTNNSTSTLTASGIISEASAGLGLTTAGTGTTVLSNVANTYSGPTTINGGVLNVPVLANGGLASSIGQSTNAAANLVFGGTGTLQYTGGSVTIDRNFTIGAGVVGTIDVTNAATTLALPGVTGAVTTGALTKAGAGTLTLSGAQTFTGNTLLTGGTLNISGTASLTGLAASTKLNINPTAGNGVVNYTSSGNSTLFAITGATVAGTSSAYYQTNGIVTMTPNTTTSTQSVVGGTGAYGFYSITGGTLKDSTGTAGGSRFTMGNQGTASATNGTGVGVQTSVLYVGGTGFVDHTNAEWWLNYSLGEISVTDSGKIDHTGSNNPFGLFLNPAANNVGGAYATLNIAGSGAQVIIGAQPIRYGNSTTAGAGDGNSAFVNVAAGVLSQGTIATTSLPTAPTATNFGYYNYTGGTIKATGTLAAGWTPATTASMTFIHTVFGAINNNAGSLTGSGAPSFDGGLTIDTNGNAVSIPTTTVLAGATGVGVTQTDLTVSGGSGYIGAPAIYFSKPASATGVPAAGYALMSGGSVVGIVITDPGTYAASETPTVTLIGGGASVAATVTSGALNTANVSGGLTKIGLGTLSLSAANTYTGGTTVSGGTLALGANNTLASAGNVTVNGGTFDLVTFTNTVNTVTLDSGIITGSTGVLTSGNIQLRSGTASGILSGAGTVTKTTTGTVTLSGANTFTGPIDVNNGTVAFATSPATSGPLGNNANINLNGGAISYTGSATNALNKVVAIGSSNGTVDVANSLGTLTIASATSTGGNLIKTGPGAARISGTTTLNAGAAGVTVSGGILQASFGTNGIGSINVGAAGNLQLTNNAADVLTLGGSLGALTLTGGARLGFDLGASTFSDTLIVGIGGTAVTSGTITLDFTNIAGFGAGTYNLLQAPSGLSGATYALGNAPNGFNYTIVTTDTLVSLTTNPYTPIYWRGGVNPSWNTLGAAPANWTTDASGLVDAASLPGTGDTVVFSASNAPTVTNTITTTLDAAVAIDSIQFTNAPTGITQVQIDAGTSGTLTLAPLSSSGGIAILAGGGNAKITAPLNVAINGTSLNNAQTWSVVDAGSTLDISGNVTFTASINKTGAGTLTLSGNNSGAGAITLSAGKLNINSTTAIGTGTLSIAAGATIDNSSISGLTLSTNNVQNWNGSFAFTGTQSLNIGTGAVTLGSNLDLTANANTLTVGGIIGDGGNNRSLNKLGAGTVVFGGNNTYTGSTTITAGTLTANGTSTTSGVFVSGGTFNFGNAGALGAGTLTLNSGTIDNTTGAAVSASNPLAINGNFTFAGSNNLTLTGSTTVAAITPTITVAGSTLALNSTLTGIVGFTKAGAGTLTLNSNNSYNGTTTATGGTLNINGAITGNGAKVFSNSIVNQAGSFTGTGNTTVNLGTLNLTGTLSGNSTTTTLAYGTTAGNTIVNVSGTFNGFVTTGANIAGSNAIFNQTAGSVTIVPTNGADTQYLANNGGYGMLNITGGTFNTGRFDGVGAAGTASSTAVIYVGGTGTLNQNVGDWFLPIRANGIMSMTVAPGGTFVRQPATTAQFSIIGLNGTNTYGILNVAGGTVDTGAGGTGKGISIGGTGFTPGTGNVAFVNAAGGTLVLGANGSLGGAGGLTNAFYNFSGATVKASAALTAVIPASTANYVITSTVFGPITNNNNANTAFNTQIGTTSNFTGGITVDTNGFAVGFINPLVAATGIGVTQANIGDLSLRAGNSGYIGAPLVQFAAPAAGGDPASGYAVISGGQVTGIVITNPGVYASGETPLITLTGGGGSIAAFNAAAVSTANTSGGLTKINAGTLSLSGANTYTGPTTITGGTLQLGAAGTTGTLSLSSTIVNNSVFAVNRTNATVQGVDFTATDIAGTGSLLQAGTGTTALTTNNTYLGGTTITAGVLDLGNGGTTGFFGQGAVTLTAGTLSFNRTNTTTLGATNLVTGAGTVMLANGGLVASSVDNQFVTTGPLIMGSSNVSTIAAKLDLTAGSSTFGSLSVQNDTATANTIALGSKTLTINGSVNVGNTQVLTGRNTHLTVTGATGTFTVNLGAAGTFRTGTFTGGTNIVGISTVDLSGLANFNVTGGATSAFTVAQQGDNSSTGVVTMKLANTANSIQAATLTVGNSASNPQQSLRLGNGTGTTNVFNIDTLNLGIGARDSALFSFDTGSGSANGTVSINNRLNSGSTVFNMGTGGATTGAAMNNVFDVTGHTATLNFGAANVGTQTARVGSGTNVFSFDKGALTFASITASTRSVAGTMSSTFNFGSVNSTLSDTVNITNGILQLGLSSTIATAVTNGTVNIAGGTVTIGATGGNSISMASSTFAGATANGTLNITGGSTTLSGDIIRVGGVGTTNATLTLNGGSLDLAGNKIGGTVVANNLTTLNFQSGTLKNVAELNNGAANLVKTTAGILNTTGTSNYTGQTLVNEGILTFDTIGNVGAVTGSALGKPATVGAGTIGIGSAALSGTLRYLGATPATTDRVINLAGTTGGATLDASGTGTITYTSNLTATGVGSKSLSLAGTNTGSNTISGIIPDNGGANTTALIKSGIGTWVLGGANTFSGGTTLNQGTLTVGTTGSLGTTTGTLSVNNTNSTAAGTNSILNLNTAVDTTTGSLSGTIATPISGINTVTINNGGVGRNFTVNQTTPGTYAGVIAGAGSFTLGSLSTNTLTLTGVNTYTGPTTLSAGTVNLGVTEIPGTSGPLGNQLANAAGTIILNGGTLQHSAANTNDYSGRFSTAASQAYNVDTNGQNVAWGTALTSTGGTLAKSGAGTLTLTAVNTYTGTTTIGAGTLNANSTDALGNGSATNTLVFTGGTLQAGGPIASPATRAVTLTSTGLIDTNGNAVSIAGVVSGGGGLTKSGGGTLTLSNTNTYTGATTVSAGTLVVNGSIATSSNTSVASGAFLGGSGTTGPVTLVSGSTLSPGNSPGTLNTGSMTWTTGANYNWQMLDATGVAGTGFDQLAITGSLTVGTGFNFNLWSLASTGPDVNGNASNFSNSLTQYWVVATTTGGGFTAGDLGGVNIVTAAANGTGGFQNGLGGGSYSLIPGGGAAPGTASDVVLKFTASAGAAPDLAVGTVTNPNLFVLQNASLTTATASAALSNGNANTGSVSGFTPSNAVLTATTGQTIAGAGAIAPSTISLLSTGTNTTAIGATVTYNTTPTDTNPANNVATVNVRIGNAPLDTSSSSTTFGAALIAATPISGTPYTNLSSNTIGQVATGTTVPALGTTATILSYTNSTGSDTGVSMQWRSRTASEASTNPGDNGTRTLGFLISDVVNLTGMINGAGTQTDLFVLQMSYKDTLLVTPSEASTVNESSLYIASLNGSSWVNATDLNVSPDVLGTVKNYSNDFDGAGGNNAGSWANFVAQYGVTAANLNQFVGSWGVDQTSNQAWAILDHNSEFAVIPEPSTLVLGGLALLGFAGVGLRRRRLAKSQA